MGFIQDELDHINRAQCRTYSIMERASLTPGELEACIEKKIAEIEARIAALEQARDHEETHRLEQSEY